MSSDPDARPGSVLCELVRSLRAAGEYNEDVQVRPTVILWTDKERQWEPLLPRLRRELPGLLTIGSYAPENCVGPAIWIRCMIDRALPSVTWPESVVPTLYLPGVGRPDLRAVEECSRELQPLAELQYRGVWFTQENTKDWTVASFLGSRRGGLGLEIAGDSPTRESMLHALEKIADTQVVELRGRRLHAADFQALLQPDLMRQLLRWLDAPEATRREWSSQEWHAFRGACIERYGLDPERDGELAGAEKLGVRSGSWDPVWRRFAESPEAYPSLPDLLRRAKPREEGLPLFFTRDSWPQCNEEDEAALRVALVSLAPLAPSGAAAEIEKLEAAHAERRDWVWAKLDQSPLARALEQLALMARATRKNLAGDSANAIAVAYATDGWRADAAVLDALSEASKPADVAAVKGAIRAIYKPWLEAAAETFQDRVRERPKDAYGTSPRELASIDPGTCVVFADGLRLDLGKRLKAALEDSGYLVEESWRFVPVPPVTPTAKPIASPVAESVTGEGADGETFQPSVRATGQALTIDRFRKLLADRGFQDLHGDDSGDPAGRGWAEYGEVDQRGHEEGWKLAKRIAEEIRGLVDRIVGLFEAGWREVRIVTDHGWLLVPGGLPKVEIPAYLVQSRWTRCGTLKPGAKVDLPTMPWHWNPDVQVVLAPGIGSFIANVEYSHGSLSPQECVVPNFIVRAAVPIGPEATFTSVHWVRLRCRVQVAGAKPGSRLDIRTKAGDAASSLAKDKEPKALGAEGGASLVVDSDDHIGTAAALVLLGPDDRVVAKQNVTVGGEE